MAGRGERVLVVVDNASDVAGAQALRPGDRATPPQGGVNGSIPQHPPVNSGYAATHQAT